MGSDDNKLHAINPNGTQKWVYTTFGDVFSSPAIGPGNKVIVGSNDGRLYQVLYGEVVP